MDEGGEETEGGKLLSSETIQVLHVDDKPEFGELASTFLEREDDRIEVNCATSASEGLDRLEAGEYDCVVSDYDMPRTDGIEFLEQVRDSYPDLPFVLFTGKGSEEVASDAISAGVTDYLQKETGSEQYTVLANRVANAVGRYRTEQELDRQNDLFQGAQDLADVGAWEYDIRTDELVWTEEVYKIYNLPLEFEPTPATAIQFYHPDDRETISDAFEDAIEQSESYDLEVRLLTDDDEQCWVRTRGRPQVEGGEVIRVRGTIQDISERKNREQKLKRQAERFEEFTSVISHDLQTPLTTVRTRVEMALETGEEHHLEASLSALDRLDELREDLAEVLRTRELVEEPTDVAVADVVSAVWETLAADTGATLAIDGDRRVRADEDALKRCFENLLDNALEHGGPDVTVRVGATDGGLYVEDDGPGIAPGVRDDLFTAGVSTKEDGSGMGLASVRQIVHAHGWEIRATDAETLGGARFEFTDVNIVEED